MASTIVVLKTPALTDPKWASTAGKPGDEVEMSVTATNADGLEVWFEIRNVAGHVMGLLKADGSWKKKWAPPMTPDISIGGTKYTFFAILRQKPTPANGHLAVVQRLKAINELAVKGTKVSITKVDACFVPKQEKLVAKYKVEGAVP